jgi:hypothetical protein
VADRDRRYALAAITLPFFFLVMSGLARATDIIVTTLDGGSVSGQCSLVDAVTAANTGTVQNGCAAGSGDDAIFLNVTGTITVDAGDLPLRISDPDLAIVGLGVGCSGPGPCGNVISGGLTGVVPAGGIILTEPGTTLSLFNLTFEDGNTEFGGAIFANGTDLEISNCLFVDNQTTPQASVLSAGGAIYANSGTIEITNSTFYGNTAFPLGDVATIGGGIFVNTGATLKLTNSTFEDNVAHTGSAIYNQGIADLKGDILADNLANAGTGVTTPLGNCSGITAPPVTDRNYNISVDNSCGFTAGSSKNNRTSAEVALDPTGLQNNGGPSGTVALESTSLARSLDTNCTDQQTTPEPLLTDQRLYTRPNSPSFCDTGAYEFDGKVPIALVPGSERLQIVHVGDMSDQINTAFTFIDNGPGLDSETCDAGNDPFNSIVVIISSGTCATLPNSYLLADMTFVTHVVNHQTYGTDFFTETVSPGYTLSARMVALPTPADSCGEWTLNLELSDLTLDDFGLTGPGPGPFAIMLDDGDGNEGCFDVDDAIVGGKIDPPSRSVRRGVRK